jgi:hypothetical protein
MAEILVKAIDHVHPDPEKDRRGAYKRGMPVVVFPDGHSWGADEGLPKFVIIKIPGISVSSVEKYIQHQFEDTPGEDGICQVYRRRLWRIRWEDLPAGVKSKLSDGILVIKAGSYSGKYDFTWNQVKSFFRNLKTNLDETENF